MTCPSSQAPMLKHWRLRQIELMDGSPTSDARLSGVRLGDFALGDVLSHRGFLLKRQVSRHFAHWAVNHCR